LINDHPKEKRIRNVVFDLGGVLITYDPRRYLSEVIQEEEERAKYFSFIFQSPEWVELDRGRLTITNARRIFTQRHPNYRKGIERIFETWCDLFHPIPAMLELADELATQGYDLYLLSNCIREAYDYLRSRYTIFKRFKGCVLSFQLGWVKPEREIYEHLLKTYRLLPQECLFIDDMERNVAGARAAGIPAVRFESIERLRKELTSRLKVPLVKEYDGEMP